MRKLVHLERKLGFWDVFCIASGAMISSGLFVLPGIAFSKAGPAMVLSYAFAGIMIIPAMLCKAELATAMPKSGGSYFFIERSMGALPGVLAGLANWFSIALKAAFALIGIGAFAELIFPNANLTPAQWEWMIKGVAIGFCLVFTIVNVLSVKSTGRVQIIMVAFLLGIMGMFVVVGIPATKHANFANFMAKGWGETFATAGLVFISYGGLTKVASVAGEIRHPGRNIPAGMFSAAFIVTLLYVSAAFVTVGVMDPSVLSGNLTPLSLAANQFMGKIGLILLSIGAMLAFVSTANSGILSASRNPMAMARDGLLPGFLQRVSFRFGTPIISIIATSGFIIAVIALLTIEELVKVASTMMLILFALVNVAVLIMRSSKIRNYRPLYRVPLYPWIPLIGIGLYAWLIIEMTAKMDLLPLVTTVVFLLGSVLWYVIYVRTKVRRESALVYMVKSAVSKEIYRSELEEELKQIAFERDQIVRDRFDEIVHRCDILDLPNATTSDEMFRLSADMLSKRTGMDSQKLFEMLQQREAASSTVVEPGLAIPHVIIPGEKVFEMVIIRCKEGIRFEGHEEPVRTVFVLAGSADERNFHLRALMAIANIVQERGFRQRWMQAADIEHIRDILLLSKRKRDVPTREKSNQEDDG